MAKNLFFQDKIDLNCSFVDGSVIIDGIEYTEYNPVDGISLPNLPVGSSTKIVFQCKVNSLPARLRYTIMRYFIWIYI
ncbi:hypothetical protein Q5M85_05715 [Paraclostridium bifermentans]|nr:hypothetical protein [Paraclostridium bifermentans]